MARCLLHVGTRLGVRIECLAADAALGFASTPHFWVLHHENGFRSECVRVRQWNAKACRFRRVSRAVFDASSSGLSEPPEDSETEEAERKPNTTTTTAKKTKKRTRPSALVPTTSVEAIDAALCDSAGERRRRPRAPCCLWVLDLTDTRPDDVGYVWLLHVQYDGVAARSHSQDMTPHAAHDFRIENACGACLVDTPLELWRLRPFMVRAPPSARARRIMLTRHAEAEEASPSSTGELIATLSGTFAPCANGMQVDFRGVRSVAAMLEDWGLLIPEQAPSRVQLYMMVLKANLGVPVVILDQGMALPPGLAGRSLSIAQEGVRAGLCFLATRMRPWCDECGYRSDVCMAVQLIGVRWRALFPEAELSHALREVRTSSVDVSRRGSVMMRLVFPKHTGWSVDEEASVVRDCNRLLRVLRAALSGDASPPCG
jgi:hypothetical protein